MKKLVVIGGGFAGSGIAKRLEKIFDVTLIDTKDYFEFTPGILRTIVDPEHIKSIQVLHARYLKRSKIIIGEVKEVSKNFINVNGDKIYFDYLVISSGSRYEAPIKEGNVVMATRSEHLKKYYNNLESSKKILIVGGGLVGIELAAEIIDHYPKKKVIIAHSHEKLIERNNTRAINYVEKYLLNKGVEILYNTRIVDQKKYKFIDKNGLIVKADMAFVCTGIYPNFEFMKKNFSKYLNEKNQLIVNDYLQLNGIKNIFVAGDVAGIKEEKTAQNAIRQAKVVSNNIINLDKGLKLNEYKTKFGPLVISLGRWNGLYTKGNFNVYGIIPAIIKSLIEKDFMWRIKYF
jgi:apoptosis-inducing factor 2